MMNEDRRSSLEQSRRKSLRKSELKKVRKTFSHNNFYFCYINLTLFSISLVDRGTGRKTGGEGLPSVWGSSSICCCWIFGSAEPLRQFACSTLGSDSNYNSFITTMASLASRILLRKATASIRTTAVLRKQPPTVVWGSSLSLWQRCFSSYPSHEVVGLPALSPVRT